GARSAARRERTCPAWWRIVPKGQLLRPRRFVGPRTAVRLYRFRHARSETGSSTVGQVWAPSKRQGEASASVGGRPNAANRPPPNVVFSAIAPRPLRRPSNLNAGNSEAPGRRR